MKIDLTNLNSNISTEIGTLVCSSSFEDRWYKIAEHIDPDHLNKILILQKNIELTIWNKGINIIQQTHGDISSTVEINDLSPAELWRTISSSIIPAIEQEPKITLVDITTFSHEVVLFFVALLEEKNLKRKVILAYAGASAYCTSSDPNEKWLSRGVKDIRSVLGFPGIIRPSKKSHLIILVGFETERAKELIVQYEPYSISLGTGIEPYNKDFHTTNTWHKKQLEDFVKTIECSRINISEFNFSCSDPISAKNSILIEAHKYDDLNITVAPMNTKVSTVGAGMAAIKEERLKLCYVEPSEYNKKTYSSPSNNATLIYL